MHAGDFDVLKLQKGQTSSETILGAVTCRTVELSERPLQMNCNPRPLSLLRKVATIDQYQIIICNRCMFRIATICLILLTSIANADEDAVAKYRNYLPEQLLALSEEERRSSVPMMFSGAANLATSPHGEFIMQANLNSLMYDGFADYESAKRAFQTDLNEEPTGTLTVWQIHLLGYRASRVNMTRVSFFTFDFGGTMNDNWAVVKGAVTIIDEKIAYPINHVDIECSRNEGICEYRQIALTLPDENSWVQSYHVGEIADETYRVDFHPEVTRVAA